jgi:trehalose synthase
VEEDPVIASAVGGFFAGNSQDYGNAGSFGKGGLPDRFLLTHPEFAKGLAENGHEHVKEHFLLTNNLKRYLTMFLILLQGGQSV